MTRSIMSGDERPRVNGRRVMRRRSEGRSNAGCTPPNAASSVTSISATRSMLYQRSSRRSATMPTRGACVGTSSVDRDGSGGACIEDFIEERNVRAGDHGPRIDAMRAFESAFTQLATAFGRGKQGRDGVRPFVEQSFGKDDAGVGDDVRNFTAVARDDRYAGGERLDDHATLLLTPAPSRLTWRAQNVHRREVRGNGVVRYASHDANAIAVLSGPVAQLPFHRTAADEHRAPRSFNRVERAHEQRKSLLRDESSEVADDRNLIVPIESLANATACTRVVLEMLNVDAEWNDAMRFRGVASRSEGVDD